MQVSHPWTRISLRWRCDSGGSAVSKLCVLAWLQWLVGEHNAVAYVLKVTVFKMQVAGWFLVSSLVIFFQCQQ